MSMLSGWYSWDMRCAGIVRGSYSLWYEWHSWPWNARLLCNRNSMATHNLVVYFPFLTCFSPWTFSKYFFLIWNFRSVFKFSDLFVAIFILHLPIATRKSKLKSRFSYFLCWIYKYYPKDFCKHYVLAGSERRLHKHRRKKGENEGVRSQNEKMIWHRVSIYFSMH